ncbi:RagB/SusD family nutrient uptake outer membrane protein [Flavivirga sp. 57AJ16]|uniref:RagB/SusD family nutrient uptake outer membrane protein n=1 Tax=Flavivirga sp. 57AJ16 TaxID=3025307 RepID=UPI002365E09B|nr:RagB/SusD family nutrient uptake outer membrane protein [Flavivirga sp. 57AJ16]MDD7888012.1 RagB/SusD family nutrient uptake outer membrane protein [Flavivirga sp. 57AJ16]
MKKQYIYRVILSITIICFSSCQLAEDLDDFEPLFALEAETAINNEATADLALAGAYAGFRQRSGGSGNPEMYLIPSIMSGVASPHPIFNNGAEATGYADNNPITVGASSGLGAYTRMYDLINRCNWLIEKVTELSSDVFETPERQTEILAEAKALRATANFYLLRLFGQFYDTGSVYGITLRSEPARNADAFPRNSVADVYAAIIADLDDAIAGTPDLRTKYYVNKTYAKGLKAKVLLYQGDYAAAATLAKDVIDNSGPNFALATAYGDIFLDHTTPALFDSPEVLFGSKGQPQEGLGIGNYTGFWASATQAFVDFAAASTTVGAQNIVHDGTRIATTIFDAGFYGLDTFKFNNAPTDQYEMIYHLRMAEIYLILAEADARANSTVTTNALDALNAIRIRAGATTTGGDGFETYPATITLTEFLEAVRIEKYVELGLESGEEWFDLVRYHFVDGFDVSSVKASATNPDKFILPIDGITIDAGGGVVEQNPSY